MRLSTRNHLRGTVESVEIGAVMATVRIRLDGGDQVVTSAITKDAVEELDLKQGQPAIALIKATEVTIAVD